jgi:carbon monoxide dehydrogenase subunit G
MKVQIDKRYPLPCRAEIAWQFLQNVEAVAACMPGAKITERLDEDRYKGTVTAKVGPATMSFRGEVQRMHVDQAARSLRLVGKGTDSTGSSGASMNLTARVEEAEGGFCTLVGACEMSMSGKAAAFGGRMMSSVADQILKQFADNLAAQVGAQQAQQAMPATPGSAAASEAPVAVPSARPLNALAFAWTLLRDWVRGLFSKRAA